MSSRNNRHGRSDAAAERKIRQQSKKNRRSRRPQRQQWIPDDVDDWDDLYDLDYPQEERVMPRGERERRRNVEKAVRAALNNESTPEETFAPSPTEEVAVPQGIVCQVSTGLCRVRLNGRSLLCDVRGALSAQETGYTNVIAVGDRVVVSEDDHDRGVVETVLPRQSVLARPDEFEDGHRKRHRQQVIVANADQLLIVASWLEPHFWPELVDRYIIAAEWSGLRPIICVNKIDLARDPVDYQDELRTYQDLGYRVLFTSAFTGEGLEKLRVILRRKMTALAGLSGVGKSSLLNAIQPGLQIPTQTISEASYEGRHTTTQVSLLVVDDSAFVVDTPGIRRFGISGLRPKALIRFYPEIQALAGHCRFGDCSHQHEPGCAVKEALEAGNISAARYKSYTRLYDELSS